MAEENEVNPFWRVLSAYPLHVADGLVTQISRASAAILLT